MVRDHGVAQALTPLYIRPHMTIDHDSRLRRLRFRAWHRGFREADLILGPFADTHGPNLTPEQFDTLETLLEQSDREIDLRLDRRAGADAGEIRNGRHGDDPHLPVPGARVAPGG